MVAVWDNSDDSYSSDKEKNILCTSPFLHSQINMVFGLCNIVDCIDTLHQNELNSYLIINLTTKLTP